VYGCYSVLRDLTLLKEAEEKFRRVVETAPDAIVLVNPEGRIVMLNPQAEHMFGYAELELIGQAGRNSRARPLSGRACAQPFSLFEKPRDPPHGCGPGTLRGAQRR